MFFIHRVDDGTQKYYLFRVLNNNIPKLSSVMYTVKFSDVLG